VCHFSKNGQKEKYKISLNIMISGTFNFMKTKRDKQILRICLKIGKIDENKKNLEKK
jgi:hypothetical protein